MSKRKEKRLTDNQMLAIIKDLIASADTQSRITAENTPSRISQSEAA